MRSCAIIRKFNRANYSISTQLATSGPRSHGMRWHQASLQAASAIGSLTSSPFVSSLFLAFAVEAEP